MFLKNDSIYKVGIHTTKGCVEIRPNEVIHIMEDDLLDNNQHLVVVTEKEYENFINCTPSTSSTEEINPDKLIGHPESCKECLEKNPSDEDCKNCKEKKIEEELNELNSENNVPSTESNDTNNEALKNDSIIAKLKEQWEKAKKPAEKAKIAKQLKKLEGK